MRLIWTVMCPPIRSPKQHRCRCPIDGMEVRRSLLNFRLSGLFGFREKGFVNLLNSRIDPSPELFSLLGFCVFGTGQLNRLAGLNELGLQNQQSDGQLVILSV